MIGKGDKERLVPIGSQAIKQIRLYQDNVRVHVPVQKGEEDMLFLNRRGKRLTRMYVFTVIKDCAEKIGLQKRYFSPHFPPFLCHAFNRRRSRFTGCAGNVGPCFYYYYRDLHTLRQGLSAQHYYAISSKIPVVTGLYFNNLSIKCTTAFSNWVWLPGVLSKPSRSFFTLFLAFGGGGRYWLL